MSAIHTVVVAIDFSDNARDAIDAARELVSLRRGRLHLLHVVPDVFHESWMVQAPGVDMEGLQRRWLDDAEQQLMVLAAGESLDPRRVLTATVVGRPAAEIVRYAEAHGADAIVLGSHGHGLVRRFVLGSVAERVIRHASCPVLVVPHRTLREPARPEPRTTRVKAPRGGEKSPIDAKESAAPPHARLGTGRTIADHLWLHS